MSVVDDEGKNIRDELRSIKLRLDQIEAILTSPPPRTKLQELQDKYIIQNQLCWKCKIGSPEYKKFDRMRNETYKAIEEEQVKEAMKPN